MTYTPENNDFDVEKLIEQRMKDPEFAFHWYAKGFSEGISNAVQCLRYVIAFLSVAIKSAALVPWFFLRWKLSQIKDTGA